MEQVLLTKQLIVPADIFNSDPISTLQSYIGYSSQVEAYKVSNGVTGDGNLIVTLYYHAADINKIYYINPKSIKQHKLNHKTQLQYIIDNVLITLPKSLENVDKVIPITIRPITQTTAQGSVSYFARPVKEVLSFISTISTSKPKTIPQYFPDTQPKTLEDMNRTINNCTIPEKLLEIINPETVSVDYEILQVKKYMATMNMGTQLLKNVNMFEYYKDIPEQIPKSANVAWLTHYNNKLKDFISKHHFGMLFTIPSRTFPDIVVYIPSVAYKLSKEQLKEFENLLLIDIINFQNVKWVSARKDDDKK